MRLFVAVVPPVESIARAVEAVRRAGQQGLRWTPVENLHITVKFMGEVADAQVSGLCSALKGAELSGPIELRVAGITGFPGPGRPRILAAALTDDKAAMKSLAERVDRVCHGLGFPLEARAFNPHITLARSGRRVMKLNAADIGAAEKRLCGLRFEVNEIFVMASNLSQAKPKYSTVAAVALR